MGKGKGQWKVKKERKVKKEADLLSQRMETKKKGERTTHAKKSG